jgi:hypothetical protein
MTTPTDWLAFGLRYLFLGAAIGFWLMVPLALALGR